jgi:xanthine dehydrogenase YagS FAD-binding subunit
MRPFEYASPATKEQAVNLLGTTWGPAEVLAGGTDLLALMKDEIVHPKLLVNLKEIKELQAVRANSGGLRIGALAKLGDLADNLNVVKDYPALAEALNEAASPQIRNLATLGGNLCQRPRCWYFRGGFGLLPKDEAGKELVAAGENRYHAILGNDGPAKFVSPSTLAPALIAYRARIVLVGPKGKRELPLEQFFLTPKTEAEREHNLRPNEIVAEVMIPPAGAVKVAHYEIRQKAAFDWPLAVSAVALTMSGSTVESARVVMGYVAPVPWISVEAAQALVGRTISEETARAAAETALARAKPLSHNAYKVQLARVALQRAILKAVAGGAA